MARILPKQITALVEEFAKLPSIGPKTAERLTMYLVRHGDPERLAETLSQVRNGLGYCDQCHSYATSQMCELCADASRDDEIIVVVAQPLDIAAIERIGSYRGRYHVLHGVLSPIDGVGPSQLKIESLLARVKVMVPNEVILATNATVEGETTALYIARLISPLGVKVTRLAHGLPVGADVEYADQVTLGRALAGRTEIAA